MYNSGEGYPQEHTERAIGSDGAADDRGGGWEQSLDCCRGDATGCCAERCTVCIEAMRGPGCVDHACCRTCCRGTGLAAIVEVEVAAPEPEAPKEPSGDAVAPGSTGSVSPTPMGGDSAPLCRMRRYWGPTGEPAIAAAMLLATTTPEVTGRVSTGVSGRPGTPSTDVDTPARTVVAGRLRSNGEDGV